LDGQSDAEKKYRNHYCFTANHRIYGGVLGIGIGNSCLVGIPALAKLTSSPTAQDRGRSRSHHFFSSLFPEEKNLTKRRSRPLKKEKGRPFKRPKF
jgi:hypothetical protein